MLGKLLYYFKKQHLPLKVEKKKPVALALEKTPWYRAKVRRLETNLENRVDLPISPE